VRAVLALLLAFAAILPVRAVARGGGDTVIAAALLAFAVGAAPGCGLPPLGDGARPWKPGETLSYDLDVLGMVKAGTMQLSVERPMSGGKVIPLRARARTSASVSAVKPFVGVALSWIDAETLLPERYRDEANEGGVRKLSDTKLLPPGPELVIEYRFGDRTGKTSYRRDREVLDALSTLTYLRAARLSPGDRFCFDLVANRRFWRVEGAVASKVEKVETAAGKFEAIRIDAATRRADRPEDAPRQIHLWFGTDARRLPLAMVSEVDIGPVSATLSAVRGAR
jgi:hypothetical protein